MSRSLTPRQRAVALLVPIVLLLSSVLAVDGRTWRVTGRRARPPPHRRPPPKRSPPVHTPIPDPGREPPSDDDPDLYPTDANLQDGLWCKCIRSGFDSAECLKSGSGVTICGALRPGYYEQGKPQVMDEIKDLYGFELVPFNSSDPDYVTDPCADPVLRGAVLSVDASTSVAPKGHECVSRQATSAPLCSAGGSPGDTPSGPGAGEPQPTEMQPTEEPQPSDPQPAEEPQPADAPPSE
ncbi:hypothetical protein HYH03_012441 [Edaphochlamys debaryana]|uniref:Uncharacterized protein n=1 Tax=Edaphochlamys debaryana TaxID=47281 RepID=A0A835XQ19_9CHLO|nr:hypothetical protein HYH03_012441 [Edaphochlamys debaryana]|eukprot:KAG2489002.1 hypothetical protein HYH03_012441 [Edaphochlamys debaryana]